MPHLLAVQRLNLHHISTLISQHHCGYRARHHTGEV
jgi:hypothetical protein